MRLYLSSYQLGDRPALLASMVRGERRGWVIANALDGGDQERRAADTQRQIASLAELGLEAADLDLREHDSSSIEAAVGRPDFLWIRGGNVFTLRMALARSGMDTLLVDGLRRDAFVCAGFSAGPCVLAPALKGLEHCDPIEDCLATYGEVRYDGLGVLDRAVVPHLSSPGHPETELLGEVAARYDAERTPHWALRDGQALVLDGGAPAIR